MLLVFAACDRTYPGPGKLKSVPFSDLQDVRLNMKRSELEKRHNLRPEGNGFVETVRGYPVYYDFYDDHLVSMRMWQVDETEPASLDRFRIFVQEAFRDTGVKPVCGYDAAAKRNAARYDFRGGSLVIIHEAAISEPGQPTRQPSVTRWLTVDADDFWKPYQKQVCVR